MKAHLFPLQNRGMARDNSISKTEEGLVFENRNIRLTANEHDTLLSVTNERGNRKVEGLSFSGTLLGWNVLDRYIILFTKDETNDHIYRVECKDDGFSSVEIFSGKLGFSLDNPIESVVDHETEDVMKIYWIDGKNPLRYLNFSDAYLKSKLKSGSLDNNPVFAFAGNSRWFDTNRQSAKRDLKVSINRDGSGNSRANGTIQYFMTFYNKNGSETSFVYVSPLVYLSPDDHGGTADGYNTNRVVLTVDKTNLDPTFDYVRTYAIVRTSENGQPAGYIIAENKILTDSDMIIVDAGNYLSAYDPTALLFIGSREVIAGTMTHKDNTLFLGDLESIGNEGVEDIALKVKITCFKSNKWESNIVSFEISKDIDFNEESGFYSYDCQLKYPADKIMGFKGGEKYRFALQFRNENGTMTKAFWIGDKVNSLYPTIESGKIGRPVVRCKVPSALMTEASKYGFTSVRLMMAQASYADRSVLAQGIVNPAVFNMLDRSLNAPYAIPSWIARPKGGNIPFAHLCGLKKSSSIYGEIQSDFWNDDSEPSPFKMSEEQMYSLAMASLDDQEQQENPGIMMASARSLNGYIRWMLYMNLWKVRGTEDVRVSGEVYIKFFYDPNPGVTVASHSAKLYYGTRDDQEYVGTPEELYNLFLDRWAEWGCEFDCPVSQADIDAAWTKMIEKETDTVVGDATIIKGGECWHEDIGVDIDEPAKVNYKVTYNIVKASNTYNNESGVVGEVRLDCYKDGTNTLLYSKIGIIQSDEWNVVGSDVVYDYVRTPEKLQECFDNLEEEWGVDIELGNTALCERLYSSAISSDSSYSYESNGSCDADDIPASGNAGSNPNHSQSSGTSVNDKKWNLSVSAWTPYGIKYDGRDGEAVLVITDGTGAVLEKYTVDLHGSGSNGSVVYMDTPYNLYMLLQKAWVDKWKMEGECPVSYADIEVLWSKTADNYNRETISKTGSYGSGSSDEVTDYSKSQRCRFYIDESIVTLNSPEIEYENVNVDRIGGLKFRVVGVANVASVISDYEMEVSNQRLSSDGILKMQFSAMDDTSKLPGIVSSEILSEYLARFSNPSVDDSANESEKEFNEQADPVYYNINMWHKSGSIVGFHSKADSDYGDVRWDTLDRKIFANLRFCKYTKFNNYGSGQMSIGMDDVRQCSGYNNQMYELKHDGDRCMYVHNVDKVIAGTDKYPIIYSTEPPVPGKQSENIVTSIFKSNDPISMRYRSSAHAVLSFSRTGQSLNILPYLFSSGSYESMNGFDKNGMLFGWNDKQYVAPTQRQFSISADWLNESSNYLFIGELYMDYDSNPATDTRYGGTSESAVESNIFLPCSEFDTLLNAKNNGLVGKKGDTYFQRWDCVKTMPMGDKDPNSVIDIVSAMLETHVNIDGRTDIDRGTTKLASMDIANFGSINRAYSQTDNFISAYDLDDKYNLDSYPSSLTWTLEKHPADEIDEWTHITLASSLKLDGDKGRLRALRRFQNTIIAFQDRGISEVMFNSRVQLNTTDGTPVELANSGKVDGKRYITEKSGCINKWSIAEGKLGIYFVDDINRNISLFNGQGVENLSRGGRFDSWMQHGSTGEIWKPKDDNRGFITHYDKVNSEVYFYKWGDDRYPCLVYSEPFATFTSFYDYMNVPMMANTDRKLISFRDGYLWLQNEGFYGNFFGEDYPFYVTYRVNPDAVTDKIWTNLEYRSDFFEVLDEEGNSLYGEQLVNENDLNDSAYRDDVTFDTVNVWNEYQKTGDVPVAQACMMRDFYPDVRRKFRIWRMDIPRDASGVSNPLIQNRIRNPWIYLKLQKNSDGISRMVVHMHDVMVKYFTTE